MILEFLKNTYNKIFYIDQCGLLKGYLIYFIIFLIYLEVSPKLKNVWIRCDSNNILKICPQGILSMLSKPFSNIYFWYPQFWDINFYMSGYIFSNVVYKLS